MKKVSRISYLIILISLSLTSCKNFFEGNDLLNELNDVINYSNLPEFSVSVTNFNPEWGTISTGSGDHKVRVTDKIVLNFEVNEGYYFDKWLVVNKNNRNEVIEDCIEFEYPQNKSENAVAKISKQNESMMIIPVCRECFVVESYYPNETDVIYPKNSSITVDFNYDIPADCPENDVSQISIKITGIPNAFEYFNTPVIKDKKIIISSKSDKKIPIGAGEVKVVTVSIPETFVCNVDGEYFTLGKQFNFSYSIDSSTSTKANIVISNGEDKNAYFAADDIVATGVAGVYNIEQVIKLSYRPTADYKFTGFKSSDEQSVVIGEVTYDSFTGCYNANATVLNAKRDENGTIVNVILNPVVKRVYKLSVKVEGKNGKSTPVINTSYYNGETFNVTFNAETDFGFTGWKYSLNGKEFTPSDKEIVSVKDISTDTYYSEIEVKVEKEPEENQLLVITPVTVKRPKIVSATPLYDTEGVYRDRRITIMFDAALSEESLYYSKDELIELGVWDAKKDNVAEGYTLLDTAGNKKYFGYQKTDDDDSIVWKAISITKRTNTNENLLKYYRGPEFDTNDTSVLRISANSESVKMPPVATDILVKVNTNLGITVNFANGKKDFVPLSNTYSWNYFTNSLYDNVKPEISELALYTVKSGNTKFKDEIDQNKVLFRYHKENDPSSPEVTCENFKNTVANSENIAAYNLSEGKVWIQAKVTDGGSGPKSLSATITKVSGNKFYPMPQNQTEKKIDNVSYTAKLSITGSVALTYCDDEYNGEFFDVSSLAPGLYKMTFTAYDKNDQDSEIKEAYFIYDKVGPEVPLTNAVAYERSAGNQVKLSWTNPTDVDFCKVEVYTQETDDGTLKEWVSSPYETFTRDENFVINTNYEKAVGGLTAGKKYQHKVLFYDYAGNVTERILDIDNTAPTLKTEITYERTESGKVKLSWKNPAEVDFWKAEVYTQSTNGQTTLQEWDSSSSTYQKEDIERDNSTVKLNSDYTKTVESLVNGTKYQHKVLFYDYAGNVTERILDIDNTAPTVTESVVYERNEYAKVNLSWKNPADNDFWKAEVYTQKTDDGTLKAWDSGSYKINSHERDNSTFKTNTNYKKAVEELENQTKYQHKILFYDYSGNITEKVLDIDNTAPTLLPVENITNLRTKVKDESVSWSQNPTGDGARDFDHIEVECWDGKNKIDETKIQSSKDTKQLSFTGLTEKKPYEYRFYSVDYSGNRSKDYTVYKDSTHLVVKPTSVTNIRTSALEETLNWANPGGEADYLIIDRCLDGKVEETFTQSSTDITTNKFTGLTNQKKYEYRFYTVDYAGNKSTTYYTYKDNTGPTSLTSNCTGSRIKAMEETVNWINPTGNDVDHIEIDCYYNDNATKKTTFVQSPANKVTSNKFTGLTNQTKYTYRFYSVDYSGNRSSSYSTYVDNIGPAKPVNIITGSLNGGIRLIFDAPNDEQYDHINIPGATTENVTGKHGTAKVMGKTNGTSYECSVYAVDFAGNKSEPVTVREKAGIKAGDYCYLINNQDIIFSEAILNDGENLVGIVISDSIDSTSKVETAKILRITVDENKSVVYNHPNTAVYDNTYGAGVDNQTDHGEIFYQSIVNNNKLEDFPKIKHLYYDVNNKNKNIITWYLPGLNELLPLNGYWSGPRGIINTSLSKIPSSIKHMGWLGDGMSEMVSCTFNNSNASTPKFSVAYFTNSTYKYYELKSYPTHATNSLLMAQINPAY